MTCSTINTEHAVFLSSTVKLLLTTLTIKDLILVNAKPYFFMCVLLKGHKIHSDHGLLVSVFALIDTIYQFYTRNLWSTVSV